MDLRTALSVRRTGVFVAVLGLSLAACGSDDDGAEPGSSAPVESVADAAADAVEMSISDAWSRQPAEGQTTTAVYGIVSNPGDSDVTIVSASSSVTDSVELHETIMGDDGAMQMVEREEGFVVPAGGEFAFEPGGPHVMILDIDPATYPAEIEVTLTFDGAESLTFAAEVRTVDDEMDMGEADHDHSADEEHEGVDATALHELDEQLEAGTLDASAQRAVVADAIAAVEAMDPAAGSAEAALLVTLQDLDAALEAGDVAAAATLAAEAHEQAHDLDHHG